MLCDTVSETFMSWGVMVCALWCCVSETLISWVRVRALWCCVSETFMSWGVMVCALWCCVSETFVSCFVRIDEWLISWEVTSCVCQRIQVCEPYLLPFGTCPSKNLAILLLFLSLFSFRYLHLIIWCKVSSIIHFFSLLKDFVFQPGIRLGRGWNWWGDEW